MPKLTLVLVVAALALAGWQTIETSYLRSDLEAAQLETADLRADLDRLRSSPSGSELPRAAAPSAPPAPALPEETAMVPPRLAPHGASPEVIARAVRDLQDRVAHVENLEAKVEGLEEKVEKSPLTQFRTSRFIRNLDQAESRLGLTPRQRADMDDALAYAKRDLETLYATPNDEGKTWKEVAKVKTTTGDGLSVIMSNFGEIQKFRNQKVPGSNETYGQAEQRIRDRGKQEMRDVLTPTQRKEWDESSTDALFASPGTGPTIAFSSAVIETSSSSDD